MAELANDPAAADAGFCRSCGYALRGLAGGQCPECGRGFDGADCRTFAVRPPRSRVRRWARRAGLLLLAVALAAAAVPGWYWWTWHREQAVIDALRGAGGTVEVERVELGAASRYLPARWAFLGDRAAVVDVTDDRTGVLGRVDLGRLAHVRFLGLVGLDVTDPMLAQLRGMTALRRLDISGNSRLDGTGLRHLAKCRALVYLDLGRTGLTDAGLADVGRLTSLEYLIIADTPVTDAGLRHLAGLTSLADLDLDGTAVTDAGLVPLRGLTSLRLLDLRGTQVTAQGRRDLRKALPDATIDH